MDKRQDMSQAANKTEMDILSGELSDTDSNRESEACTGAYGGFCAAQQTEYKRTEDSSEADNIPDIKAIIDSFKQESTDQKTRKKIIKQYETRIGELRDKLFSPLSEVGSGQEFQTCGGARQNDERTEDESEPKGDIDSSDSDETTDTDTSQEFEDFINEFGSCRIEVELVKNDEGLDMSSRKNAIQEANQKLAENIERLMICIQKKKDRISILKTKNDAIRKLQEELAIEQDLDKLKEGLDKLLSKKRK